MTIERDIEEAMSYTRAIGQTTNSTQVAQFAAMARTARLAVATQLQAYLAGIADTTSDEYHHATQTKALIQRWIPLDERAASLGAQPNDAANAQSDTLSVGEETAVAQALSANVDWLVRTLQAEVQSTTSDSTTTYHDATIALLIVILCAFILATGLG